VLSHQDLAYLDTLVSAVERRYETGTASQVDVLRVQNDRARRAEQVRSDESARSSAYVTVNRLLNRNLTAGWARMQLPPVYAPVPFTDKLLELASKFDSTVPSAVENGTTFTPR